MSKVRRVELERKKLCSVESERDRFSSIELKPSRPVVSDVSSATGAVGPRTREGGGFDAVERERVSSPGARTQKLLFQTLAEVAQ